MSHWHVNQNVPGYLPEGPTSTHDTKGEAIDELKQYKQEYLDDSAALFEGTPHTESRRMIGNAEKDLSYHWVDPDDSRDLGVIIQAWECTEEECEHQEDYF